MKELFKANNISNYITDGIAATSLYNNLGGLLVKEGNTVPSVIYKIPVFIYLEQEQEVPTKYDIDKKIEIHYQNIPKSIDFNDERIKHAIKTVSLETVEQYLYCRKELEDVLISRSFNLQSFNKAVSIVEQTIHDDRIKLFACIRLLRSADKFTLDHSMAVYLLFVEAIEDFKNHHYDLEFYDTFKDVSKNINFNSSSVNNYAIGALLHDIGKAFIPDELLKKGTSLTNEEFNIVKRHPEIGVNELKNIGIHNPAILEIVGDHHEYYRVFNKNRQSPLAQICNIIDIYDACRSERSYKDSFNYDKTMFILDRDNRSGHWDTFIYKVIAGETLPRIEKAAAAYLA